MRADRGIWGLTVFVAGLLVALDPTLAQSLIQRFYNSAGSRTPMYGYNRVNPYGSIDGRHQDEWLPLNRTTYRTMCVRLCDGFYFPISYGVHRDSFYRDNRACKRRCDGKARLFYYPSIGGSIGEMIDLFGRTYKSLPNAFRYRKSLIKGCTCRAAPWSAEAKARHLQYAIEEDERTSARLQKKKRGNSLASVPYEERDARPPQSFRPRPPHFARWQTHRSGHGGWSPRWWGPYD